MINHRASERASNRASDDPFNTSSPKITVSTLPSPTVVQRSLCSLGEFKWSNWYRRWRKTKYSRIWRFLMIFALHTWGVPLSVYLPIYPMYQELPVQYSFLASCRRLPIGAVWRCDPFHPFSQSIQSITHSIHPLLWHPSIRPIESYLAQRPRSSTYVCVCVCMCVPRTYVCMYATQCNWKVPVQQTHSRISQSSLEEFSFGLPFTR